MEFIWFQAQFLFLFSTIFASHRTLFEWKTVQYEYPNKKAENEAISKGRYRSKDIIIIDVDRYAPTDRYFVTTPLTTDGVPATLAEIDKERGTLKAFPSFPTYNGDRRSCEGPFSVFRIKIDECGLMWVVDSGRDNINSTYTLSCPPKLLIYDLNDGDRLILRYEFPPDVYTSISLPNNIVTESFGKNCSKSFAYMSDDARELIVFDYARLQSWGIINQYFYPYPGAGTPREISTGLTGDVMAGIFGLALDPPTKPDRRLYFHSFSSFYESWVPVRVLRNRTLAKDPVVTRKAIVRSPGKRAGQSINEVMTDDEILIYVDMPQDAIACWNSRTPFILKNQHIVERNTTDFQTIQGMKLQGNTLYFASNRYPRYAAGIINESEVNYRVMVIDDVKRWLANTPCVSGSHSRGGRHGVCNKGHLPKPCRVPL